MWILNPDKTSGYTEHYLQVLFEGINGGKFGQLSKRAGSIRLSREKLKLRSWNVDFYLFL